MNKINMRQYFAAIFYIAFASNSSASEQCRELSLLKTNIFLLDSGNSTSPCFQFNFPTTPKMIGFVVQSSNLVGVKLALLSSDGKVGNSIESIIESDSWGLIVASVQSKERIKAFALKLDKSNAKTYKFAATAAMLDENATVYINLED